MKTYEVKWCVCPTSYNTPHIAMVEAEDEKGAEELAWDAIKKAGHGWFTIESVHEYKPPTALGKVISLG